MVRKKSFSSELAHIYDSAIALAQEIKNYQETVSGLIADAEKYREVEPLLKDISRVSSHQPPSDPPPAVEPTPEISPAQNLTGENPAIFKPAAENPPATEQRNPRERHARIKKILNIGANIDQDT
jgi:hypothetical protein